VLLIDSAKCYLSTVPNVNLSTVPNVTYRQCQMLLIDSAKCYLSTVPNVNLSTVPNVNLSTVSNVTYRQCQMLLIDSAKCYDYITSVTNGWIWRCGVMVMTGETRSTLRILWCNGADRRNTKYSKNTPPIVTFPAANPTSTDLELNMGPWGERPLTKCKKAIPLQAWTGPEGSRKFRFPDFKTFGTWRWLALSAVTVSPTHRQFLLRGNIPGTHFC
jgi:hypothetical protein